MSNLARRGLEEVIVMAMSKYPAVIFSLSVDHGGDLGGHVEDGVVDAAVQVC
jgi:hypothetical protein